MKIKLGLLLLSISLILLELNVVAQEINWFEPGSNWTYNYGTLANAERFQTNFGIEQTIFAGVECGKIDTENFPFTCAPVSPPYYFYESNDSIFFATEVDSIFRMVFDFNAVQGDNWTHQVPIELDYSLQNFHVEVVAVNQLTIDGQPVKELVLSYTNISMPPVYVDIYPAEVSVLEYIGATTGFFVPLGQMGACDNETDIQLQCFNSTSLQYINPEFGSCFLSTLSATAPLKLKIYPNPAKEYIILDIEFEGNSSLKIKQIDGKAVFRKTIESGSGVIKLPTLSAGMYLVEIDNAENKYLGKLLIR